MNYRERGSHAQDVYPTQNDTVYLAHGICEGEIRGKCKYKNNNNKRVL